MRGLDKLVEHRAEPLSQCDIGPNDLGREASSHSGESALKLVTRWLSSSVRLTNER